MSSTLAFPGQSAREQFARAVSEAALLIWDAAAPGSAERGEILTPAQVAKELHVSPAHVTNLCGKTLKAFRVGRLWRVHRADLEKFKSRR